jgi:hypothetical protein
MVFVWDNSEVHHGKLLWQGENIKNWSGYKSWINASKKIDINYNVSIEFKKTKT